LVAAACLTKYFAAVSLVPLLLGYSLLRWPRVGWRVLYLAIPVAVFLGYDWTIHSLYGRSALYGAGSSALTTGHEGNFLFRGVITLSYSGGCLAMAIFYAPLLWSRRVLAFGVVGIGLMVVIFSLPERLGECKLPDNIALRLLIVSQFSVFVAAGVSVLVLAVADLWHARNAESALLVLWTAGTFAFCWTLNWAINGRTILPMAPAASILIVRRIDRYAKETVGRTFSWKFLPLAFLALVSMAVAWDDTCWANNARAVAGKLRVRYLGRKDTVWYTGHWGFQYYMDLYGFPALDLVRTRLLPGNVLVLPSFNTNLPSPPAETFSEIGGIKSVLYPGLTIMWPDFGASFYGNAWGLLPFVASPAPKEYYYLMTVAHGRTLEPQNKKH
jgi:hypothetical protein